MRLALVLVAQAVSPGGFACASRSAKLRPLPGLPQNGTAVVLFGAPLAAARQGQSPEADAARPPEPWSRQLRPTLKKGCASPRTEARCC